MRSALFFLAALAGHGAQALSAQEVLYNTPGYEFPAAQIRQAAWLSGHWRGVSNEGDQVLESWVGPKGKMMAGVSLSYTSNDVAQASPHFSDHMVIVSTGNSLAFHHNVFEPFFGGSTFFERRLLRIEEEGCKLYFHAVTFACERDQSSGEVIGMTILWREEAEDGFPAPELMTYRYTKVR